MHRIINMMAETLEIREKTQAKPKLAPGPPRMPLVLRSSTNIYSSKMAKMPQIQSGQSTFAPQHLVVGTYANPLDVLCPFHKAHNTHFLRVLRAQGDRQANREGPTPPHCKNIIVSGLWGIPKRPRRSPS